MANLIDIPFVFRGAYLSKKDTQGTSTFYGFTRSLGVSTANPRWLIARETIAGDVSDLEWASQKFDQVWDDRTNLFATPVFNNDNSLRFRNSNNRLEHPNLTTELDSIDGLTPNTIGYWFNTVRTAEQCIVGKQSGANTIGWRSTLASQTARLHFSSGAAATRFEGRSPNLSLSDGQWHYVCWSWSDLVSPAAGKFNLVVDGIDYTSSATINSNSFSTTAASSSLFKIGVRDATALDYGGFLDELFIYDRQLSVSEMIDLYNLGGAGKPGDLINAAPYASDLLVWNRCGDNDSYPLITNLGTLGSAVNGDMATGNMIAADIIGEVP